MQNISIYDKSRLISEHIISNRSFNEKKILEVNKNVIYDDRELIVQLEGIRPDVLIMILDNSDICSAKSINDILNRFLGINIIVVGVDYRYEVVREYFVNGVCDYLRLPLDLDILENSLLKLEQRKEINYIVNNLNLKIDALIDNIFLGGGEEEYIIKSIINQIYEEWNNDPIICEIVSDKAKKLTYEIMIDRKTWLEKFLYRNDFTYHFGFKTKNKEEIINNWINCFKEASAMVTKYQMIDDKLVYNIGKYVVVHVDEQLSLYKVSRGVYLNASYISHIFKKITNMNFIDYMLEVKIDRAKILLRDSSIKICDVAHIVGYRNTGYFTKNFKEKTGYSPSSYQKLLKRKYKNM